MRNTAWVLCSAVVCLVTLGAHAQITVADDPGLDKEVHPRRIAARSGFVWLVNERITPHSVGFFSAAARKVTTFPVPCDGCADGTRLTYIEDVAIAPDGSAWFPYTEVASDGSPLNGGDNNFIGRMTMSGGFTKFRVPTMNAFRRYVFPQNYSSIDDAADGMWFVENAASKVGHISWGGDVTEYALPSFSSPSDISVGPGGDVWFTMTGKGQVGRITPGAAEPMSFFTLPANSPVRSPLAIVATENAIFVSDVRQRMLVQMTPNGAVVNEMPFPDGGTPGFAADLDDSPQPRIGLIYWIWQGPGSGPYSRFGRFYESVPLEMESATLPAGFYAHDIAVTSDGSSMDVWIAATDTEFHDTIFRAKDPARGPRGPGRRRSVRRGRS